MPIERFMHKISVVFPLYNEEARLNILFRSLKNSKKAKTFKFFEFIFVDDGSSDNTVKNISHFINKIKKDRHKYKLIKSKKNFGKGHALKLGVQHANYSWIITMDPDLSVNLSQIIKWFKKYSFKSDHAYFGSRNHPLSTQKYKYYRKFIGDTFQYLIFLFIDKNIKDTQCGFKLYNKKYAKNIFKNLKTNGYAHDIELILLLKFKKIKIVELPVNWVHKDKGKVNILIDPIKMLIDIILIKFRYAFKRKKS